MNRMIFMFGLLSALALGGCSATTDESDRDESTGQSESEQTSGESGSSQGGTSKDSTVYRAVMSSSQTQPGTEESAPGDPIPWTPGSSDQKKSDK